MKLNEQLNNEILKIYENIKEEVNEKIVEYKNCLKYSEKDFFAELAFCILTPQSKALSAWSIIEKLKETSLLYSGLYDEINPYLNTIRFKNTKAKRLVKLRELMTKDNVLSPKKILLSFNSSFEMRKWIVENIDGMGMKEASHFIRNIGLGQELAILDRHILRILKELCIIDEIPKTLTMKKYIDIENSMREYAKYINVDMDKLDLILWYRQVGYMFK